MDVSGSNLTTCIECAMGTVSSTAGSLLCAECTSSVDFQPFPGQATCVACPTHAIAFDDHKTCICAPDYYAIPYGDYLLYASLDAAGYAVYVRDFIENSSSVSFDPSPYLGFWCAVCPIGADCTSPGTRIETVVSLNGYFTGVDNTGTTFFTCLNDACQGGGDCAEGYTGPTCTECDQGMVIVDSFTCGTCLGTAWMLLIFIMAFFAFMAYIFYRLTSVAQLYDGKEVYFKIMISCLQVNSLAMLYGFEWDSTMGGFLQVQGQLSSFGSNSFNVQCLQLVDGNTFEFDTLVYLLGPFGGALFVFFCVFFRKLRLIKDCRRAAKQARADTRGAIVAFVFLLYPYLVERFALVFSCVQLGANSDDYFLVENLDVKCWTAAHLNYIFVLALPLFVVYVLGFPMGIGLLLSNLKNQNRVMKILTTITPDALTSEERRQRRKSSIGYNNHEVDMEAAFFRNYAFLFLGYTKDSYLWEIMVICRKAVISIIGVIVSFDQRLQGMLALVVLSASVCTHVGRSPFLDPTLNHFETLSLLASSMTFLLGIFTLSAGENGQVFPAASIIAVGLNAVYLVIASSFGVIYFSRLKKKVTLVREQRKKNKMLSTRTGDSMITSFTDITSVELTSIPPPELVPQTAEPRSSDGSRPALPSLLKPAQMIAAHKQKISTNLKVDVV